MVGLKISVLLLVALVAVHAKRNCDKNSILDLLNGVDAGKQKVEAKLEAATVALDNADVNCERLKLPRIKYKWVQKNFGEACKEEEVEETTDEPTEGEAVAEVEDYDIEIASDEAPCSEQAGKIQLLQCAVEIMAENAAAAKPLVEALAADATCEVIRTAMKGKGKGLRWLRFQGLTKEERKAMRKNRRKNRRKNKTTAAPETVPATAAAEN